MKKLVAIALALMLLLASAACAESAIVEVYSNPKLTAISGGEGYSIDMTGLDISLAIGLSADVPTVQIDAVNGGETLLSGELQITDSLAIVDIEGLSRPLSVDISAAGPQALEGLRTLLANPEELMNLKLPAFTGVNISKPDLVSLASMFLGEPETDASGARVIPFTVPYEMVKELLSSIGAYADAYAELIPEEARSYVDTVVFYANQLAESDSGIALDGAVSDDGATAEVLVNVYPVNDGVTADEAAGALVVSFADNQANLSVLLYDEDQTMSLGEIALTSNPEAATLDFSANVLGEMGLNVSLYPQDGAQVVALAFDAAGEQVNASLVYGEQGEGEFADAALELAGWFAVEAYAQAVDDGNGTETGALTLNLDTYDESQTSIELNSEVTATVADFDFRGIENADNAIDIANLSDVEQEQLDAELNDVLANLMSYVASLDIQPAA